MRCSGFVAMWFVSACLDPGEPGNLVPKTVDEDATLPRIEVNGTMLHAEAFGDPRGPLIVMMHGGPGGDYRNLLQFRALADEGYRVVFWDNRGAGLSKRHAASSFTFDQYLEDLRQVIEHYTTDARQPIIFVGQSWGAMYATWFINTYGDYGGRVLGAVLSEPGAFTSKGLKEYVDRQFPPFDVDSEELNDVTYMDQLVSGNDHARADYLIAAAVLAGAPREHNDPRNPSPFWRKGAVVLRALGQKGLDDGFDWTTHLGEYPHKVLFLRGELNENMPLDQQKELASHYAKSEVITIAGVGHEAIWEKQDEFLRHVRDYLAEIGGAR